MNRIIIWGSIFSVIAASLLFFSLDSLSWKPFRCNTQVSADIATKNGNRIEFNVNINVITLHKENSEVLVIGSLKDQGESYTVYRRIFVTHKPADINGYSTTVITSEKRHPKDNVPNTLWQHYVLPEVPGVAFYVEIKKLKKNLLFYKGLDNPILICTITEE
ncbi:hypothetical protein [Serratia marcescens]|uniref:hypothetical protein n=1 Tax=Serratia marcescens TaxID=615 RepID=UPI0020406102|nr:hypothetical protein [Serratia marcescens]MCM2651951.1 hypothetical protein [Serratia marcescens]